MPVASYIVHKIYIICGKIIFKFVAIILLACIGAIPGIIAPAEAGAVVDRRFVTNTQRIGYYVDVNTIEIVNGNSGQETVVDIYQVELKKNRMHMERMHFLDHSKYYTTLQKEYRYDNRSLLNQVNTKTIPKYYLESSPEGECLTFAREWKKNHIHKTRDGEWLD